MVEFLTPHTSSMFFLMGMKKLESAFFYPDNFNLDLLLRVTWWSAPFSSIDSHNCIKEVFQTLQGHNHNLFESVCIVEWFGTAQD